MKKLFLSLSVMFALVFASCSSLESKKEKLSELEKEAQELADKAMRGEKIDEQRALELAKEISNLEKEIAEMEAAQDDDDDDDDD